LYSLKSHDSNHKSWLYTLLDVKLLCVFCRKLHEKTVNWKQQLNGQQRLISTKWKSLLTLTGISIYKYARICSDILYCSLCYLLNLFLFCWQYEEVNFFSALGRNRVVLEAEAEAEAIKVSQNIVTSNSSTRLEKLFSFVVSNCQETNLWKWGGALICRDHTCTT